MDKKVERIVRWAEELINEEICICEKESELPFRNVRKSDAGYRVAQDDMLEAGFQKVKRKI
ncbi:hypothetical protein KKH23_10195 [Patescibacteria group bacterium]|nr:hypothetical protein [Patescibacteria group bacterium]